VVFVALVSHGRSARRWGGLAFAPFYLDRRHHRNGFARLGLAPPECLRTVTAASSASGRVINKGDELRKRTERVSASFGNNPLRESHPTGNP